MYRSECKTMIPLLKTLVEIEKTIEMNKLQPSQDGLKPIRNISDIEMHEHGLSEFQVMMDTQMALEKDKKMPSEFITTTVIDKECAYDSDPDIPGPSSGKKRRYC
jgi:hypothetical protein